MITNLLKQELWKKKSIFKFGKVFFLASFPILCNLKYLKWYERASSACSLHMIEKYKLYQYHDEVLLIRIFWIKDFRRGTISIFIWKVIQNVQHGKIKSKSEIEQHRKTNSWIAFPGS